MISLFRIAVLLLGSTLVLSCSAPGKLSDTNTTTKEVELAVADFDVDNIKQWQERSFRGNTVYSVVEAEGHKVLRADTKSTASALFREMDIDLKKTPFLN